MLTKREIAEAIVDPEWQAFRISLLGLAKGEKCVRLAQWLREHPSSRSHEVQVENYLNALRRGGLLD